MLDCWTETFPLGFTAIDRSDRLTLSGAFDYFQSAAIQHAELLGVGRQVMAETGQVWILSRMSVMIENRPKYRELITVRSWSHGWERLFALREYDMRDSGHTLLVRGVSAWLIMDRARGRPARPQGIVEPLPRNENRDAFPGGPAELKPKEGLRKTGERRAFYSDIDFNGHVNNARYIQWIQDAADPALLEQADRLRLDINYLSETKPGDLTEFWTAPLDQSCFAVEGRRSESGQPVFRAELRFFC
ncbi:MAG: acyl-ACP thioesterase [Spirochaetaceae bacterium]|jgi:acyl-ACP thioesterase|nr:acyl-ACP thioesterase [Spirochaetaceae bacterium]